MSLRDVDFWLTSDQHFYHKNIIKYCNRPFASVDEMNAAIVENYNKLVSKDDVVLFLGDFAFIGLEKIRELVEQLNGQKFIILGNHDKKATIEKSGLTILPRPYKIEYDNSTVWFDHYPYKDASSRHESYGIEDCGDWIFHGHVHEKWLVKGRQINVGVDAHEFRPIRFSEICQRYGIKLNC